MTLYVTGRGAPGATGETPSLECAKICPLADPPLVRRPAMIPRERLDFSPIEGPPPLQLPDGVRMVVWPVIALEDWDVARPMARTVIPPPQGQPLLPDVPNWSWHEYGMRVGF